jgi:hypothetical protein
VKQGKYHETGSGNGKGPSTIGGDSSRGSDYDDERLSEEKGKVHREKVVTLRIAETYVRFMW